MRVLGVDFGLRRVGLALSDERETIATPLRAVTVRTVRDAPAAVAAAAEEAGAEAVVVGVVQTKAHATIHEQATERRFTNSKGRVT